MKKTLTLILALLMILSVFAGCTAAEKEPVTTAAPVAAAEPTAATEPAVVEEPAVQMPTTDAPATIDVQEFVSGESNGGWAMVAAAIADKANAYFEGFPITVTTGGSVANPAVMSNGDAQIGLTQGIFLNKLLAKEDPYAELQSDVSLKAIASLDSTALYFIVDGACPYNTLGELIASGDKYRVGAFAASSSSSISGVMLLKEYGLTSFADLQDPGSDVYIADGGTLTDAYADHHIDLYINNTSTSSASLKDLLNKRESKILAIDPEIIASLCEKYGWGEMTIVGGTYENNPNDVKTVGFKSILIVREDVPDELAYVLAKVCAEEKAYLETVQASYKAFEVADMVNSTVIDMHPGALKYWQEAGIMN